LAGNYFVKTFTHVPEEAMNARVWIRPAALAVAIALVGMASGGFAQTSTSPGGTDEDHSAHHPKAAAEAPAAPAQSDETPKGMISQDSPSRMMMGRDMKEMMSMMRDMMNMMMSAQGGMMTSSVEGRIATLKTELEITDAQASQWDRFADALRASAKSMGGMHQKMMSSGMGGTLLERLDRQEAMLSAHLTSVRSLKEALQPLYASFSDEQKKIADGMMIGPMGMM
jgi:LTXXQ motif family protein